jgi:hypothetical protein
MYLLILPVSGGGFVSQLSIIEHLCETKYKPDIILSSSGGNVAAYISSAADWKWPAIERIAKTLNKNYFLSTYSSIASISYIMGFFQGSSYTKGSGVERFLHTYFTSESIQKYEIWTGTYNKNRQLTRLFCNCAQAKSKLKDNCIDRELTQSMPSIYAAGDIDLISKYSIASASIPTIVPSQTIDNEEYVDGGVSCSSPLTVMQEPILRYIKENNCALHMIYINSVDLSCTDIIPSNNLIDTLKQTTRDIIRSQTVIDRLSAYEILRCHPGDIRKETFPCNYDNLQRLKEIENYTQYSLLEIYPLETFDVDLTTFTGQDVIDAIHKTYDKCSCRLWWVDPVDSLEKKSKISQVITDCKSCLPLNNVSCYATDLSL